MNRLIDQGVAKGLIAFDAEKKNITCKVQNKRLRFSDPEEKVRANAYLSLVLEYGYTTEQIDIEVAVEHRVLNIYSDIVVECKREVGKAEHWMAEAEQLRAEAETELEAAKHRIEAMLLGEPV